MKNRTSGLQVAQRNLTRELQGYREQLAPREYATLLDLHARWLAREMKREESAQTRWSR